MKRYLVNGLLGSAIAVLCHVKVASADFFSIAPNGTYLHTDPSDSVVNPAIINLSTLSTPVHPGDTILIQRVGAVVFSLGSSDTGTSTGAVFSSTNTFLDKSNLNRIPGAIDAGVDFTSPTTFGGLTTDISQDFEIDDAVAGANRHFSSATVTVPAGANYLFVGLVDDLFSDNSDPNGDYGVTVTLVPEPASLSLFGLGTLLMLSRRSKKA